MAPVSQGVEPPEFLGRFTGLHVRAACRTARTRSDTIDPWVYRRLIKLEVFGGQVVDTKFLEPDRAAAVRSKVDDGGSPVGGDRQVVET